MAAIKLGSAKFIKRGPGFGSLIETLGGIGQVTLGVQGDDASKSHPSSDLTVGELAAAHELGLVPGAPLRSWLGAWLDRNEGRMRVETETVLRRAASTATTATARMHVYRAYMKGLAEKWADDIAQDIRDGKVKPELKESTKAKKGHGIPLLDTETLADSITGTVKITRKQLRDALIEEFAPKLAF